MPPFESVSTIPVSVVSCPAGPVYVDPEPRAQRTDGAGEADVDSVVLERLDEAHVVRGRHQGRWDAALAHRERKRGSARVDGLVRKRERVPACARPVFTTSAGAPFGLCVCPAAATHRVLSQKLPRPGLDCQSAPLDAVSSVARFFASPMVCAEMWYVASATARPDQGAHRWGQDERAVEGAV